MRTGVGARVLRVVPTMWCVVLAALMLGPALLPGYVLSYDMVWVPDLAMRGDFFGLGSGLPRAVPSDLVVAALDEVVPGMVLQKAMLLGTLVLAGAGAWRMVGHVGRVAGLAASTLYVWNPFVAERLGIGHWPLLMTYASLPWLHLAARRLASGERTLPQVVLWLGFASLSPVGGIIAGLLATTSVAVGGRTAGRPLAWTCAAVAALNAPWIVAGALHGSGSVSDASGVSAFAAHGEGVLPAAVAVLGLGGIWNAEVVPVSRTTWVGVVAVAAVLVVCAAGVRPWRQHGSRADRLALTIVAVAGLTVALAGAMLPGPLGWLVTHVPGAGLVRDGTRFVALLAPVAATLFGLGAARLSAGVRARPLGAAVATFLVLAPVSLMPDAALGLSGRLGAVDFPAEFDVARREVVDSRRTAHDGDLLVLPFTPYRRPAWNEGRRTLDAVGRFFPVDYLASDTLVVSGEEVPGEDARARRVARAVGSLSGSELEVALAGEGIRWVVLDREAASALAAEGAAAPRHGSDVVLGDARVLHSGPLLTVWELPLPPREPVDGPSRVLLLLLGVAWLAAAVTVAAAAGRLVLVRWTTWRQMRHSG